MNRRIIDAFHLNNTKVISGTEEIIKEVQNTHLFSVIYL